VATVTSYRQLPGVPNNFPSRSIVLYRTMLSFVACPRSWSKCVHSLSGRKIIWHTRELIITWSGWRHL